MTTLSASVHEWSVGRRASGFVQVAKDLVASGLKVLVGARNFERGVAAATEIGSGADPAPA